MSILTQGTQIFFIDPDLINIGNAKPKPILPPATTLSFTVAGITLFNNPAITAPATTPNTFVVSIPDIYERERERLRVPDNFLFLLVLLFIV